MEQSEERDDFIDGIGVLAVLMMVTAESAVLLGLVPGGPDRFLQTPLYAFGLGLLFAGEGYRLVSRRRQRAGQLRFMLGNAGRLLLPWLILVLFALSARIVLELHGYAAPVLAEAPPETVLKAHFGGTFAPHLLLLPALFLLRLLAPLTPLLMRQPPARAAILLVVTAAVIVMLPDLLRGRLPPLHPLLTLTAWGVPFLLTGMALARCEAWLLRHAWLLFVPLAALAFSALMPEWQRLPTHAYHHALLLAALLLFLKVPGPQPTGEGAWHPWGRYTLPAFLLHIPLLPLLTATLDSWFTAPVALWLASGTGLLLCFGVAALICALPGFGPLLAASPESRRHSGSVEGGQRHMVDAPMAAGRKAGEAGEAG